MTEPVLTGGEDPLMAHVATIVAAYANGASLSEEALAAAIRRVHSELRALQTPPGVAHDAPARERAQPAVPVRKSVTPDYLVCLEDGQKVKMLKRYIMTRFHQTPAQYRAKWGLPADYPMVAPNYAKRRSDLAKAIGLGTKANGPSGAHDGRQRRAPARASITS